MPSALETVASVAATPLAQPAVVAVVSDEPPQPTVQEPHVTKVPSQTASADPVAVFADEFVGQHEIDDLSPVYGTEVIAAEIGTQVEPHFITSVVSEVEEAKEVAEFAEIPTPAPELVALIEETPSQEVSFDACGSASKPEALDAAVPQLEPIDDAAYQPVAAELQEAPCVEVVLAVGSSVQPAAVETEHAVGEAQLHVQDTIVQTAEEVLPSPEVEADVPADTESASHQAEDVAPAEVEAQPAPESFLHEDRIVETQDTATPAPVLERAALIHETPGPEIAADVHEPDEAAPVITPEFEEVGAKTQDHVTEGVVEAPIADIPLGEEVQPCSEAELPTQIRDTQAVEALSTGSNLEATTAALATVDEDVAVKAEATSTPDVPAGEAEALTLVPQSVPVEDTLAVVNEASEPAMGAPSSPAVEDTAAEPVTHEAQDLVEDAVPIASEPVAITPIVTIEEPAAQDALAPIDQPSSEPVPQFVDEAVNPPIVSDPVPEVISAVEVEVQLEPQVEHPTVDTFDEPLAEDAEPTPLAPEHGVLVEENEVVVNASEPETLATELERVEVGAPGTVIEDVPAPVEAEESFPVTVEESDEDVASEPEGRSDYYTQHMPCSQGSMAAPIVEINGRTQVSEPQQVVDLAEQPLTSKC